MDHEALYGLLYERRWTAVLDGIHRQAGAVRADPLLARAVETFLREFFAEVEAAPGGYAEELEKLFLLHTGHLYRLPYERFAGVVERLVALHEDRPEAALAYARYCPENECCAALLRRYEPAPPTPVAHARDASVRLAESRPATEANHTISLFRSPQEVDFFAAKSSLATM
jgi:hypothetical protein